MPRRSNEFQRLVASVQRALIPSGAKVTESAMVDVPGLSEPREIDVLIETSVGPYHMKIAVEAKDHHRKLSVDQLEALVGKYSLDGGIRVNKVIVITRNGFTKTAEQKAKMLGIELLTLTKAEKFDWVNFHPGFVPISVHKVQITKISPDVTEVSQECLENDGQVYCSHGHCHGNLSNLASQSLLRNIIAGHDKEFMRQLDSASSENRCLGVNGEFKPDHPHHIQVGDLKFPIETIRFTSHVVRRKPTDSQPTAEFTFNRPIHICGIQVEPAISGIDAKTLNENATIICGCCGGKKGIIKEWIIKITKQAIQNKPSIMKDLSNALAKSSKGDVALKVGRDMEEKSIIRFRGREFPLHRVHFRVHAQAKKVKATCNQYVLDNKNGKTDLITQFEAINDGNKYTFTLPNCGDGSPQRCHFEIRKITEDEEQPRKL